MCFHSSDLQGRLAATTPLRRCFKNDTLAPVSDQSKAECVDFLKYLLNLEDPTPTQALDIARLVAIYYISDVQSNFTLNPNLIQIGNALDALTKKFLQEGSSKFKSSILFVKEVKPFFYPNPSQLV